MHIFNVSITTVQDLKNVSQKAWKELNTQSAVYLKHAGIMFKFRYKNIEVPILSDNVSEMYISNRKSNGNNYEPTSLDSMKNSTERHLLYRGTWSYLGICRRSVLPYTWFCNCLLDYDYVLHNVNFANLYWKNMGIPYLCETGLQHRNRNWNPAGKASPTL
jgi:hypothetical protein